MPEDDQIQNTPFKDFSLWSLLISNVITIIFALTQKWDLSEVVIVYSCQTIIIGVFVFIKIITSHDTDRYIPPFIRIFPALLFLLMNTIFNYSYLISFFKKLVLKDYLSTVDSIKLKFIIISVVIFLINHLFSYFYNQTKSSFSESITAPTFFSIIRIIPLDFMIALGPVFGGPLFVFLIIKTSIDVFMHYVEHQS